MFELKKTGTEGRATILGADWLFAVGDKVRGWTTTQAGLVTAASFRI